MKDDDSENMLGRRDLLTGLGTAVAGMALVQDSVANKNNPAAQVDDRSSSIRITGMKTYWVGPVVSTQPLSHRTALSTAYERLID